MSTLPFRSETVTRRYLGGTKNPVNPLKKDAAQLGKNALVIGGAVLAGYALFRLLTPNPDKETPKASIAALQEPAVPPAEAQELAPSPLLTAIKGAVVSFLLGLAREKLSDVIAQFNQRTNAQPHS